jgi:UDPglucose 6-dehydrogenase
MRIAMVGSGYVGLVSGVCFADFGPTSSAWIAMRRRSPRSSAAVALIFEPGRDDLI